MLKFATFVIDLSPDILCSLCSFMLFLNAHNNSFLMHISRAQFSPQLVLVSAGFDAARFDPLGRYLLSPVGYSHMMHSLCALAGGRVVMALEGGYNLGSISECFGACVSMLLGDPAPLPPEDPIPNDRSEFSISFGFTLILYFNVFCNFTN